MVNGWMDITSICPLCGEPTHIPFKLASNHPSERGGPEARSRKGWMSPGNRGAIPRLRARRSSTGAGELPKP